MADEVAAKLFQDEKFKRFEDGPLRLVVSTKVFRSSLEPLVAKTRFDLAKAVGTTALEELKGLLLYELERVEKALQSPNTPEETREVNAYADQVTLMVTLRRQDNGQAGYAYFSHKHTSQIRGEREEREKCKTCEQTGTILEEGTETGGMTSLSVDSHDSPYM